MKHKLGKFVLLAYILVNVLIVILASVKCALISNGILFLLMYVNIVANSITNVSLGREIDVESDRFWKIFFIALTSFTLGIGICL